MDSKKISSNTEERDLLFRSQGDPLLVHRDSVIFQLSIVATICFFPFAIKYAFDARYDIVGLILFALAIFVINAVRIHQHKPPPLPLGLLLIPLCTMLAIALSNFGILGAFWCYPAVILFYFVLKRTAAHLCCFILVVVATSLVSYYIAVDIAVRLFLTLLLCIITINVMLNIIVNLQDRLLELSIKDPLTHAFNRRHMEGCLNDAIERFRRSQTPAVLLLFDIDHFKAINDQFGHAAGDKVLVEIVGMVDARARKLDVLFRTGGEEFVLLLPQTKLDDARGLAEHLRELIEAATLLDGVSVTVSFGVAALRADDLWEVWMKRADDAMYRAKAAGRNRVCSEDSPGK